jgi:hypothetical protein
MCSKSSRSDEHGTTAFFRIFYEVSGILGRPVG